MQLVHAVNGFARPLAGEHLGYRSFHPYAAMALLTRCLEGGPGIAWETDPAPADADRDGAAFVWVAAHSTGTSAADATYHLDVDGVPALSFTTVRGERVRHWSVTGRDGIVLTFDAVWEDGVEDLFGYMRLEVPARLLRPGRPLTLAVRGEESGRRDWYMTFQYPLRDSLEVRPQPALLATPDGPRQLVHVCLDILEEASTARISLPGQPAVEAPLSQGYNRLAFPVPAVDAPTPVCVTVDRPGHGRQTREILLQPVRPREIWVLHHSHVDIGYSDLQADVEIKQIRNLRDALDLWRDTAHLPPEARFRWNTEITWPAERFLAAASAEERERFIQAVREGGIGLNALYTNPLTGICRPEELLRLTDTARRLEEICGVAIHDAMITDIPGSTWATATALAQAGIRYYSSGPNHNPGLEGCGDRVGQFNLTWGDKPFRWKAADGEGQVLVWVAGRGYSAFHGERLVPGSAATAAKILAYMEELEASGYPYGLVQLRYTIGGDNGPVDPRLPEFVAEWNRTYVTPRFVVATAGALFEEFERRHGADLPVHAGDISPYWEDGALSTLRELSLARRASERLVQAETLACLLPGSGISTERWDEAWSLVHLSDEHTWGAHNSVSEPDCAFAREQWRVKRSYMEGADKASRELLRLALGDEGQGEFLEVCNTASWERTDVVELDGLQAPPGTRVLGDDGAPVPCQRLADGRLAFLARDVPALGVRRYRLQAGEATPAGEVTVTETTLVNGLLAVEIDPASGAIRHLRSREGTEHVKAEAGAGLNQFLRVPGTDPALTQPATVLSLEVVEPGPLVGVLRVTLAAPGCRNLVQEYRLVEGRRRLEIVNRLDREEVREKESIHFAFPLAPADGAFHLDGGWGVVRPGEDTLPGSCREFLCAGRWLDLSLPGRGVTWTTVDSPLVQLGALVDESPDGRGRRSWRRALVPGSTFYSYAMNNHWHTNYMAAQPGPAEMRFALHPHGGFSPVDAHRRGLEDGQPLHVRRVTGDVAPPVPLLRLSADAVRVSSLKPSRDGHAVMVRLCNSGDGPVAFRIQWGGGRPARVLRSTLREERGPEAELTLRLPAHGLLTLRCEWDGPAA